MDLGRDLGVRRTCGRKALGDRGYGLLDRRDRCDHPLMLCAMTGQPHRLFWMRSAWWCQDCHQKVESCCEGGGCPSISEVLPIANGLSDDGQIERPLGESLRV